MTDWRLRSDVVPDCTDSPLQDNGSPVSVGGSNHPLRGGKGSNWEGGTRVPSFVTGGLLPRTQAGKVHDGLLHIVDWHATICRLAGVDPASGEPDAVAELDGISAWPWISGQVAESGRTSMVYDHRMFLNASRLPANKTCHLVATTRGMRCSSGAIRHDGWKLVVGYGSIDIILGPFLTPFPALHHLTRVMCSTCPCSSRADWCLNVVFFVVVFFLGGGTASGPRRRTGGLGGSLRTSRLRSTRARRC